MGRKFVSHTQICGVDLCIIKRKSAWLTYLHIYVEWGPPTLASLRSQLVLLVVTYVELCSTNVFFISMSPVATETLSGSTGDVCKIRIMRPLFNQSLFNFNSMSGNKFSTEFIQIKLVLGLNSYDKCNYKAGESWRQLDVNIQWATRLYLMLIKFK